MNDPIYFYGRHEPYYALSNFAPHGFEADGAYWRTVEHYFQAQKFPGTPLYAAIRDAPSPKEAKRLGRSRDYPLRADWEAVKDAVMLHALRLKFRHPKLRGLLLETGARTLVEKAPSDYYWGCGADGSGRNRLGELLMRVRSELLADGTA